MRSNNIYKIYQKLLSSLGPQHWWPADSNVEVIIGAILTQNTNWKNVENAINNLKEANILTPDSIINTSTEDLSILIKPVGYYNVKAMYLKLFFKKFLNDYYGEINRLKEIGIQELRNWLLSIKGIGEETADSIMLYALKKPVFVVDVYTRRIFLRHKLIKEKKTYREIRELVMKKLPKDPNILGEFHALLIEIGKSFCKKTNPLCKACVLFGLLDHKEGINPI